MARSSNNSSFSPSWNFQRKEDLEFANPRPQIYILFYGLGSWRHDDLAAVEHCQRYHYESSDKSSIMDFSPRSCGMCPCHLRPIFQMVDFFSLCQSATNWPANGFLTPTTWGPVSNAELDDPNFSPSQSSICIVGTTQQGTSGRTGVPGEEMLNVLKWACLCAREGDYFSIHKLKIPQEYLWWLQVKATRHLHKFGRNLCRQHVWI